MYASSDAAAASQGWPFFLCLLCAGKITSPLKPFESTHRIYNDTHTKEYNGNDTASWL